eukprot:1756063-Pyramimonas_sp.AAC.1
MSVSENASAKYGPEVAPKVLCKIRHNPNHLSREPPPNPLRTPSQPSDLSGGRTSAAQMATRKSSAVHHRDDFSDRLVTPRDPLREPPPSRPIFQADGHQRLRWHPGRVPTFTSSDRLLACHTPSLQLTNLQRIVY